MNKKLSVIVAAMLSCSATLDASAQETSPGADPGAIQQLRELEERQQQLREQLERQRQLEEQLESEASPETATRVPDPNAVRFRVREIRFSSSEILGADELEALSQDLVDREISLAELQNFIDLVNRTYRDRGIVTAQAILPPQDLTDGIVEIQLIEGRLGEYHLEGAQHTRSDYILQYLTMSPGDLVELPVLERDLTRFNLLHDLALRAEIGPGQQVGLTDVRLQAMERPRHTIRVSADNSGNEATGRARAGVVYRNASLAGRRDALTLSANQSNGYVGAGIGYSAPLGHAGTRANINLSYDRTEIVNGPVSELGVRGSSLAWAGNVRHPLILGPQARLDIFAGFSQRTPKTILEGVLLQDARVRSASIGVDGHRQDAHGYWFGTVSVVRAESEGLQAAQRDFTILRGSLHRTQQLGPRYRLTIDTHFQFARGDAAPSSEQFLIGGVGSVRGYETGQFGGDRGHAISVELHHPIISVDGSDSTRFGGFIFADMGRTYPFRSVGDPQPDRYNIRSIGWGLDARLTDDVTLRATIARALVQYPETTRQHYVNFRFIWNAL